MTTTRYEQKSWSHSCASGDIGEKQLADNWARTFGKKNEAQVEAPAAEKWPFFLDPVPTWDDASPEAAKATCEATDAKVVFVCSPFGGNLKNVELAKELCRKAMERGAVPYAPHVFFPLLGLDDRNPEHRKAGTSGGKAMLVTCDEVWVYNANGLSDGMIDELIVASILGIQVRYFCDVEHFGDFDHETRP